MKKHIIRTLCAASAVLGTLALCGCGKLPFAQKTPDFGRTYTVNADITYDKLKASAEITRVSEEEWAVRFTEPEQLCGITVSLNKDGCAASLGGLSVSAANSSVYTTMPRLIASCLSQPANAAAEDFTENDGVLTYSGTLDGKKITITADPLSGDYISLKCPYQKLSVNFSGQKPFALSLSEEGAIS